MNDFESSSEFLEFPEPYKNARVNPPSMCLQGEGKGTVKGSSLSQKREFPPF